MENPAGFIGGNKEVYTHVCLLLIPSMSNKRSSNRSVEKERGTSLCPPWVHACTGRWPPKDTSFHL